MSKPSDVTVTDLFCGAGGSSLGAAQAGGRLRMALNHWDLAIETHNSNFPDADHDCTDVSATDPRRYPSTQILIASPECTNHSLAKGKKRKGLDQRDMFVPLEDDPAATRSRATMWDVPRFAEFHDYELIVVENVVDVRRWVMFDPWLRAMHALGYRHREVYLNSMFAHPTPQSRDRVYVVFWKRGNRPPDLDFTPSAWCSNCDQLVEAVQSWKPGRAWGRYRQQYLYLCPKCAGAVDPYYFAALNAIDFSVPCDRIGDRSRPLRPRTLDRIRHGLEKFGRDPLVVVTNMTSDGGRVRSAISDPGFTQTASRITALVSPFSSSDNAEPHPVVVPAGFVMQYRNYEGVGYPVDGLEAPLKTFTTHNQARLILRGSALMTLRDHPNFIFNELDQALPTQVAAGQQTAVIARAPFLAPYYRSASPTPLNAALPTATTVDRHALVSPAADDPPAIEDCYFRMLQPHEIQAGMAFPTAYVVLGTKRDQVKQLGNAVTPPVMRDLVQRGIESLEPAA